MSRKGRYITLQLKQLCEVDPDLAYDIRAVMFNKYCLPDEEAFKQSVTILDNGAVTFRRDVMFFDDVNFERLWQIQG